jgi:hypothetical protein
MTEPLSGTCHCGRIAVSFAPSAAPAELRIRECQCSFCRRHGARTVSDPRGRAVVLAKDGALQRYRFDLATADFLVCRFCGVYVGAVVTSADGSRMTVNAAGTRLPGFDSRQTELVSYDDETAGQRLARRHAAWTPVEIMEQPAEAAL